MIKSKIAKCLRFCFLIEFHFSLLSKHMEKISIWFCGGEQFLKVFKGTF